VALDARRRFHIEGELFGLSGRLMFGDAAQAYALAGRINQVRQADAYPEAAVQGGELYAAALLHELMHAVIQAVSERSGERPLARALRHLRRELGEASVADALRAFCERFPPPQVASGERAADAFLGGDTQGTPNAEVALEEALLVRLANANPALERLQELFDDAPLRAGGAYPRAVELLEQRLTGETVAGEGAAGEDSLMALLWAPQRGSPTSLEGQLRLARERWAPLLGERYGGLLARLLRSVDVLREERSRGPAGPGPAPVLDAAALRQQGEHEAFSPDSDWMPSVVLVAKSTYVWLAQLERRHGREVRRLDQVPDEALAELAGRGFNGLWLIGLWERSQASQRIKQRRGQHSALASAYALYDYVIAGDLGGEAAFRELEARARRHGIRLAGDMVPNHVGVDGRWVAEHPDWFVQLDHAPYPGYRFEGPDLSTHPAMSVTIEDHYWDDSDAAVVFRREDRSSGETRFIYHGNDGTSMPWNDTAQLDYLKPEVREAVIQTILHVARLMPIIRFDAAMTLAKRHIQRLWYPPPGEGGAIPSRSAYGSLDQEEFERRMPVEFWREVVDRVAAEAPGTLLLAEAFWMMEGYFVRTLGMHRVYNSAFMHMLKREENADYRELMKNVLAFDPRILGRFVNFMNNPDEETAIAQFGDGDKYFGVCVLMATMPGLPMFGHGQVEGFREKYGMEYRAPTFEEEPDARLIERHRREIAPLLYRRRDFAGAETFRLFDAVDDEGRVNEDVYAYSNRSGRAGTLVLYNNRYPRASGRIRASVPFAEPWSGGGTRREALHEALGLAGGDGRFTVLRESARGLTYVRRTEALAEDGWAFALDGFQTRVFTDVFEVEDVDGSYAGVERDLAGEGVADLEGARLDWLHRDVRSAFLAFLDVSFERASDAEGERGSAAGSSVGRAPRDRADVEPEIELAAAAFLQAAARHARPLPRGPAGGGGAAGVGGGERRGHRAPEKPRGDPRDAELPRRMAAMLRPEQGPARRRAARPERGAGDRAAHGAVDAASQSGSGATDAPAAPAARAALGALEAVGAETTEAEAAGLALAVRAALALAPCDRGAELYESLRLRGAVAGRLARDGAGDPDGLAALPAVLLRVLPEVGGSPPRVPAEGRTDAATLLTRLRDEDAAREFLRVHVYREERWFVRERYRLLAAAAVAYLAGSGSSADERTRLAADLVSAEEASGYRFGALVPGAAPTASEERVAGGAAEEGGEPGE